jgi:hypothetical protein
MEQHGELAIIGALFVMSGLLAAQVLLPSYFLGGVQREDAERARRKILARPQ